jgi:hypothetical protein
VISWQEFDLSVPGEENPSSYYSVLHELMSYSICFLTLLEKLPIIFIDAGQQVVLLIMSTPVSITMT